MAEEFDETKATKAMDQYSRQIGTIGVEAMKSLAMLDVLVVGMKGTGVEVAKNIALLGARSVTIADDEPAVIADLGTNYWLTEEHVKNGTGRAAAVLPELKRLNPYCDINLHEGAVTVETVTKYSALVVTTDVDVDTLKSWGDACHNRAPHPTLFIVAVTNGLTATLFSDIGNGSQARPGFHEVKDANGEALITNVVDKVEYVKEDDKEAEIHITTNELLHRYHDDDLVSFNEVKIEGMWDPEKPQKEQPSFKVTRVYRKYTDDEGKPRESLVGNRFSIKAGDIAPFEKYTDGGFVTEVKEKHYLSFRPFSESLANPLHDDQFMFPYHDQEKMFMNNRGAQLHFARRALWAFQKEEGRMPALHSTEDAEKCVGHAKSLLKEAVDAGEGLTVDEIDEEVVRKAALYAQAELPSFCAILGGIAAQETVKLSGKYTPIRQWQHFDEIVLVDDEVAADAKPTGTRYDHLVSVLGQGLQDKIHAQKWFLVGCGALGCEYMKAMALMGLGCRGGYVTVTDNDRIELSNLNRQFLFRPEDVGLEKSVCGGRAAKRMNSEMVVKCLEEKVCPETEATVFTHEFWADLDGVWNALDNVKARQYTDSKIVFHQKVLLESGTLGTKANSECIVPHKTKSYNDYQEQTMLTAIPMCTLRHFPHLIEHCIEWARAEFSDVFEGAPKDANKVLADAEAYVRGLEGSSKPGEQYAKLQAVKTLLEGAAKATDMNGCIQLAMDYFVHQFRNRINDLTHTLPRDHMHEDPVTKEMKPFWTGSRRFPNTAEFDIDNEAHLAFLHACANLYAFMFHVPQVSDLAEFKAQLRAANVEVKPWAPPSKKVSVEEEGQESSDAGPSAEELAALKAAVLKADLSNVKPLEPADFEKDDDSNFHIDFMSSAANMRGWNYNIKEASRFKVKMIAGRITPALATTTAMITGFVVNDFYRLMAGKGLIMGTNVNLATGQFESFEMEPPHKTEAKFDPQEGEEVVPVPEGWGTWDKVMIEVSKDTTVSDFVKQFPSKHHDCECVMLYKSGAKVMMHNRLARGAEKERLAALASRPLYEVMKELYEEVSDIEHMEGSFEREDEIAAIPPLYIRFV